jgi:hypothetical protein
MEFRRVRRGTYIDPHFSQKLVQYWRLLLVDVHAESALKCPVRAVLGAICVIRCERVSISAVEHQGGSSHRFVPRHCR